jgi:hypothetical protein
VSEAERICGSLRSACLSIIDIALSITVLNAQPELSTRKPATALSSVKLNLTDTLRLPSSRCRQLLPSPVRQQCQLQDMRKIGGISPGEVSLVTSDERSAINSRARACLTVRIRFQSTTDLADSLGPEMELR